MKNYVGIDIGGTNIKLGVINEIGEILHQEVLDTEKEYDALLLCMKKFIKCNEHYAIQGIGISTPGIVTTDGYMQTSGAIKCFLHRFIKQELEEYFSLPVAVENDAKCAAAGEKWLGSAKELSDFVCLTLGTAVGGALYHNGKLHRGLGGLAGEFGVALSSLTRDSYDEASYSYHAATVAGLCRSYSMKVKERVLDAKEIYRRCEQGDQIAEECIQEFYHACAVLFVNIACMIAPEVILIGGGISNNQEAMKGMQSAYEDIISEYPILSLIQMPKLRTCTCRNHAGMLGAVYTLLHQNIK